MSLSGAKVAEFASISLPWGQIAPLNKALFLPCRVGSTVHVNDRCAHMTCQHLTIAQSTRIPPV